MVMGWWVRGLRGAGLGRVCVRVPLLNVFLGAAHAPECVRTLPCDEARALARSVVFVSLRVFRTAIRLDPERRVLTGLPPLQEPGLELRMLDLHALQGAAQ